VTSAILKPQSIADNASTGIVDYYWCRSCAREEHATLGKSDEVGIGHRGILPFIGTVQSVTAKTVTAPANAAKYPQVRTVAFVSKQDTKNLEYTVEAVRAGKLTIPIGSRFPLRDAAEAHAAFAKGSAGKILLLP
jgi:hypothetical protein